MTPSKYSGKCFCGNIRFEMELVKPLGTYTPRECDCMFCRKHGAAYLSDSNGKLVIFVEEKRKLQLFKQGSNQAEFLICTICGILVAVCYYDGIKRYAAINSRTIDCAAAPGKNKVVSPERLLPEDKVKRWKEIWFNDVCLEYKRV